MKAGFTTPSNRTAVRRELARSYAQRALDLQPDSPEAHLALGFSLYYGDRDYDAALKELAIAERAMPNESQISLVIGAIQRRQGRWAESTANLEKAVSLSPNDTCVLLNLAYNYWMVRDYEAANRVIDRGLAIEPRSISLWELKSGIAIDEKGDFSVAEKSFDVLAKPPGKSSGKGSQELSAEKKADLALSRANTALMEGQYDKALAALGDAKDEALSGRPGSLFEKRLLTGVVQQKLGHAVEAQAAFSAAKELASADVHAAPNDASRHAKLARALAHLGEKEAAIAEAMRATELLPESADAFEGPTMTAALAEVYALTGENAKAIELLDGLLSRPSGVTVASLRVDPAMDRLRDDPKFQELLQKYDGGT